MFQLHPHFLSICYLLKNPTPTVSFVDYTNTHSHAAMPKNSHLQHSVVGQALFTPWQTGLPQLIPGDLQLKRQWGVLVDCMWYLLQPK